MAPDWESVEAVDEDLAMRVAIGSDHRGHAARSQITESVRRLGYEIEDMGAQANGPVDYPDIAFVVAGKVSTRGADRGVLIGGTGLGMCIAANKFPGVRAAPCHDELTAEMSRRHNDLNVLCLPADLLSVSMAERIVEIWLKTPFEGGRHARRVKKITAMEQDKEWWLLRGVSGVIAAAESVLRSGEKPEDPKIEVVQSLVSDRRCI